MRAGPVESVYLRIDRSLPSFAEETGEKPSVVDNARHVKNVHRPETTIKSKGVERRRREKSKFSLVKARRVPYWTGERTWNV